MRIKTKQLRSLVRLIDKGKVPCLELLECLKLARDEFEIASRDIEHKAMLDQGWRSIESAPTNVTGADVFMAWGASPLTFGIADEFELRECWREHGKWFHLHCGRVAELNSSCIAYWKPLKKPARQAIPKRLTIETIITQARTNLPKAYDVSIVQRPDCNQLYDVFLIDKKHTYLAMILNDGELQSYHDQIVPKVVAALKKRIPHHNGKVLAKT